MNVVAAIALCLAALTRSSAASVTVYPGAGYPLNAYTPLQSALAAHATAAAGPICVAHSADGARDLLFDLNNKKHLSRCKQPAAIVLLGATPEPEALVAASAVAPVLVVAGTLDGVSRVSAFAALRHRAQRLVTGPDRRVRFAALSGASHHSFASGAGPTAQVRGLDLQPTVSHHDVHRAVASLAVAVASSGTTPHAAEIFAGNISAPLVAALKQEGSAALGVPICNSDFPTNPSCNYPKYPDFSLPPGPAKAPSPLPPANCVCGSPWVTDVASPVMAGVDFQNFKVASADAFHDVSDEHPFHLPHIWTTCSSPSASCTLNITTLTMPVAGAGSLWPNASQPLSALEMRVKLKSREETWESAGLGKTDPSVDKKNMTVCRIINEKAWAWALANADAGVRDYFEKHGEPLVMVDDKEATIGITGPQWIKDELVYKRTSDTTSPTKSHVEVQSWTFVVGEFPVKSKYLPSGMHYCKLLSPARAMEWIYTDGLRRSQTLMAL